MYGGKYLYKIFPFLQWGTHCFINQCAFRLLAKKNPASKHIFPSVKDINNFEDMNGPDGAWLRGNYKDSNSAYNPITDEGDAPKEAVRLFQSLATTIAHNDIKTAAKEAAWLSHVITDQLWPPHQIGYYKNHQKPYFFWNVRSNWYDGGLTGSFWHKHDHHSTLEALTVISIFRRNIGRSRVDDRFVHNIFSDYKIIEQYLKKKARNIHKIGIYERFIQHGWSKTIKHAIDRLIFPRMISVVASVWYAAILFNQHQSPRADHKTLKRTT